jgi:hypothetical protein
MGKTKEYKPSEEFANAMSLSNMKVLFDYEEGKLDTIQSLLLFSELLKSGLVWQLEEHFQRTARDLIQGGYLNFDGTPTKKCYE